MDYEHLLKLGAAIAHHMTGAWRVDRRHVSKEHQHQGVKIIGDQGKVISLYQNYHTKDKIAVIGLCPDYGLSYQQQRSACLPRGCDSIKVSPTRQPRHIAADIERRLMPNYETILKKAEAAAQNYKKNMATLEHIEHALRCVSHDLRGYNNNTDNTERRYNLYSHGNQPFRSGELRVRVYRGLSCDLHLNNLSLEAAIKILALLKEDKAAKE